MCAKVAERLVSICGTRFLVSFSSVLLFPSSFFFSSQLGIRFFSSPVLFLLCPASASSKALQALQGPDLPTTYSLPRLDSTRLASPRLGLFPASFNAPLEAHLLVWSSSFPVLASLSSESLSLHPPLRPLLSTDFSSPSSSPPTAATPSAPPSPTTACALDPILDAEPTQSRQWPTLALSRPLRSPWAPLPPKMAKATQLTSPRLLSIFRRTTTRSRRP